MHYLRLVLRFIQVSFQEEAAYRANFFISLFYSLLNLVSGLLAQTVLFGQVEEIQGWDYSAVLAILGVFLTVSALRGLFIGPGLDVLAGVDGEIWSGNFDFSLLRPVNTQFLVSLRKWHLFSLFDLLLGLVVLGIAAAQLRLSLDPCLLLLFLAALFAGVLILYAILMIFAALIFWSPGVIFTWVFDGLFQMARYPLAMYPPWLRLVLTWMVPVGFITTVPAGVLTGSTVPVLVLAGLAFALALNACASILFRIGLRRYASASS